MNSCKRVFLIGHPGAGKALVAKKLAETLGWKYVDADLGLESRIGASIHEILGSGEDGFYQCQYDVLSELCGQNDVVITTDASVVCEDKLRHLLSSEFVVYLKVSVPIQMERTSHQTEFLLSKSDRKTFFEKLHHERDALYLEASNIKIDSDDSELERHVEDIIPWIFQTGQGKKVSEFDVKDAIFFHKITYTPVQLSVQQALCLQFLAQGQSAKEIAREMSISYRTVEGTLAKIMELLGCASSKELIVLYHEKP